MSTRARDEQLILEAVAAGRMVIIGGPGLVRLTPGPMPARFTSGPAFKGEEQFLQAVRQLATAGGWTHYHTRDSRKSDKGFPDLVLVRGPVLLYRELKTETGELEPDQLKWRDVLLEARQDWALWRPSHWSTIVETLR